MPVWLVSDGELSRLLHGASELESHSPLLLGHRSKLNPNSLLKRISNILNAQNSNSILGFRNPSLNLVQSWSIGLPQLRQQHFLRDCSLDQNRQHEDRVSFRRYPYPAGKVAGPSPMRLNPSNLLAS